MTGRPLVRYTGPRAAYIGAIGTAVDDGVCIAGRVVEGRSVPPVYKVAGGPTVYHDTWPAAAADLALRVPPRLAGYVLEHEVTAAGLEVSDGATVWRLEPI